MELPKGLQGDICKLNMDSSDKMNSLYFKVYHFFWIKLIPSAVTALFSSECLLTIRLVPQVLAQAAQTRLSCRPLRALCTPAPLPSRASCLRPWRRTQECGSTRLSRCARPSQSLMRTSGGRSQNTSTHGSLFLFSLCYILIVNCLSQYPRVTCVPVKQLCWKSFSDLLHCV